MVGASGVRRHLRQSIDTRKHHRVLSLLLDAQPQIVVLHGLSRANSKHHGLHWRETSAGLLLIPGSFPAEQDPRRRGVALGLARLDARRCSHHVVIYIIINMGCHDRTELWVSSGVQIAI